MTVEEEFVGDEVWGVLALRELHVGDRPAAAAWLARAKSRYVVGFLLRLALVSPLAAAALG